MAVRGAAAAAATETADEDVQTSDAGLQRSETGSESVATRGNIKT